MSEEEFCDGRDWKYGVVPQPVKKTVYLVFLTGQISYDQQCFMSEILVLKQMHFNKLK